MIVIISCSKSRFNRILLLMLSILPNTQGRLLCSSSLQANCYCFLDIMRGDDTFLPMTMLDTLLGPQMVADQLPPLEILYCFLSSSSFLGDGMLSYCTVYLLLSNCPYCYKNSSMAINPPPTRTTNLCDMILQNIFLEPSVQQPPPSRFAGIWKPRAAIVWEKSRSTSSPWMGLQAKSVTRVSRFLFAKRSVEEAKRLCASFFRAQVAKRVAFRRFFRV